MHKSVKVKNKSNGFKVMAEVYKALRFLKLHWNDVVSLEIKGGYVELKVEPSE
jgi:hypothetical protein